ncbi:hypothetical protein, partial [Mesorhizobium sp. M1136]|uniref:hypothetical protein n=1 Tax=unclassified Mesorhizobium TaxID=325217 RepID=UPI00333C9E8E
FMRDLLGKCVPSPRKTAAKKFCSKPMERNGKRSERRNKLHLMTLPAYSDPAANSMTRRSAEVAHHERRQS